jgi:GNAT superfamily N-acetyltransferase
MAAQRQCKVTRRVALAPPSSELIAAVAPWFAAALADISGAPLAAAPPSPTVWFAAADEARRIIVADDTPVGILAYRRDDGLLLLTALAVAASARNHGIGAEAVRALEAEAAVPRARAIFPLTNGFAFYFWLRVGYRPLFASQHGYRGFNAVERLL